MLLNNSHCKLIMSLKTIHPVIEEWVLRWSPCVLRVDEFKPFTPEDKGGFKTILLVRVRWVSEPVACE